MSIANAVIDEHMFYRILLSVFILFFVCFFIDVDHLDFVLIVRLFFIFFILRLREILLSLFFDIVYDLIFRFKELIDLIDYLSPFLHQLSLLSTSLNWLSHSFLVHLV